MASSQAIEEVMGAGMPLNDSFQVCLTRQPINKRQAAQGVTQEIMIIESTGFQAIANPAGELHQGVRNCREARIMLLNPFGEGVIARAGFIPDQQVAPEVVRTQILGSIDFLKGLRAESKNVRLKLYPDLPPLKLAILGKYAFLKHYQVEFQIRNLPEYVFESDSIHGGLYLPLYRYFLSRWQAAENPEYDLDTDELVFRNQAGEEIRREAAGVGAYL